MPLVILMPVAAAGLLLGEHDTKQGASGITSSSQHWPRLVSPPLARVGIDGTRPRGPDDMTRSYCWCSWRGTPGSS